MAHKRTILMVYGQVTGITPEHQSLVMETKWMDSDVPAVVSFPELPPEYKVGDWIVVKATAWSPFVKDGVLHGFKVSAGDWERDDNLLVG